MKRILTKTSLIFIFTLLTISCKNSDIERLIIDYEEILNGVKTDLSIKIISLEMIGTVSNSDSLNYYFGQYKNSFDDSIVKKMTPDSLINRFIICLKTFNDLNKSYKESMNKEKSVDMKKFYLKLIYDVDKMLIDDSVKLKVLKRYSNNSDSIIGNKFRCKYSFKNPLLNNVKQEIEKIYVISTNDKMILGIINK